MAMLCDVCNKESNNQRVCPYCFTPYPTPSATEAKRPSRASKAVNPGRAPAGTPVSDAVEKVGDLLKRGWAFYRKQTPTVRYVSAAIAGVLVLWWATSEEPQFEAGVVQSDIIATPIQRDEALAIIKQTRETAIVDVQQDEVFVSYPASTFPVREDGQLALAQQFAHADEIVEGRKRRIYFYNPNGKLFAQADGVRGVMMVR